MTTQLLAVTPLFCHHASQVTVEPIHGKQPLTVKLEFNVEDAAPSINATTADCLIDTWATPDAPAKAITNATTPASSARALLTSTVEAAGKLLDNPWAGPARALLNSGGVDKWLTESPPSQQKRGS